MKPKTIIVRRIVFAALAILTVIATYLAVAYIYLFTYAAFTWQCNIYVGEKTPEAQKVCDDFNSGGMLRVLTN